MKSITRVIIILICISCNNQPDEIVVQPRLPRGGDKLILKAELIATFTNYENPRDRNYYYLVDLKLLNNTNKNCEFYTLICGSMVNIITDSDQVSFLYHNCSADLAATVELRPNQEYSVSAILVRDRNDYYISGVKFGFIICKPKPGPVTNHDIVSHLKEMRDKQETDIWSDPVFLTATNSFSYKIKDLIDSTYSASR